MEYIIRKAKLSDYQQINNLAVQLYQLHHKNRPDVFHDTEICFSYEQYERDLSDELARIFVLEIDSKIIGYTFIKFIKQKKSLLCKERHLVSIYDFVIDEAYRNKGIGRILHNKIIQFAKEMNCDIIELDVWFFNEIAIKFYQNLGYHKKNMKMELNL